MPAKVFWDQATLDAALDEAINGILGDFVERAADIAQQGARVDTHFYQEHIAGVRPNSSGIGPDMDHRISRDLSMRVYIAEAAPSTGNNQAYVVAQAVYSIYLELEDNTIYGAVELATMEIERIASAHRI